MGEKKLGGEAEIDGPVPAAEPEDVIKGAIGVQGQDKGLPFEKSLQAGGHLLCRRSLFKGLPGKVGMVTFPLCQKSISHLGGKVAAGPVPGQDRGGDLIDPVALFFFQPCMRINKGYLSDGMGIGFQHGFFCKPSWTDLWSRNGIDRPTPILRKELSRKNRRAPSYHTKPGD